MKNEKVIKVIFMFLLVLVGEGVLAQRKGQVVHFGNPKGTVYDITFINDGTALAIAEGNTIKVYNSVNQKLIKEFTAVHTDVILSIDVSTDNTKLISAGRDGLICVWDTESGQLIAKLSYHQGIITTVKFSPDDHYILSGATDNQVILYDLSEQKVSSKFYGHTDHVLSVDFHPSGRMVASASADKTIRLWDIPSYKQIAAITNLKKWSRDISFSADSTKLIVCGDDSKVTFWNVENSNNLRMINEIKFSSNWLLSHDMYKDGRTIVTGGMDGKIRIKHSFGEYSYKIGRPLNKVLFKPIKNSYIKVVAAIMGGGVILVDGKDMKSKKR